MLTAERARNASVSQWTRWRRAAICGAALAALLVASRWLLLPRYLITFDEINFALSIRNFNPRMHQPQPPGDPLFVLLLKVLALAIPRIEAVFLAAGLLLSVTALWLMWKLGNLALPSRWGLVAALLLLFNPAFWLSSLTNPVRLSLAAGAAGVAWCLFLAWRRASAAWFVFAAGVWGVAAGFRPGLAVTLAPLVLYTACRMRLQWKVLLLAMAACFVAVASWLPVLVAASGGFRAFLEMLRSYSTNQIDDYSILLGGRLPAAVKMAWEAIVWSCLGSLSWIWAALYQARRNRHLSFDPELLRFLLVWFVPGLLFSAFFHVGDADHTLSIVPATCLAGAAVLASLTSKSTGRTAVTVAAIAVLLNVFLFLKPISRTSKASTYKPVAWMDGYISRLVNGLRDFEPNSAVTAIFDEGVTGWRNVSYYLPSVRVIVIRHDAAKTPNGWEIQHGHSQPWSSADGTVELPACGVWAWVDPKIQPIAGSGEPPVSHRDPIWFARASPGAVVQFRGLRFLGSHGCEATP